MDKQTKPNMYENYDPCFPDQPVVDLYLPIWANLPAFRSKPAFIWTEGGATREMLTYSHLNSSANTISTELLVSLQRGDTVLLLCSPGLHLVELLFGCQRAGLTVIPIMPPHPSFSSIRDQHKMTRILKQTKPKAVVTQSDYLSAIHGYISASDNNPFLSDLLKEIKWVKLDSIQTTSRKSDLCLGYNNYSGCKPEEVYLIQYTSGGTGVPKPVLVSAGSAVHNARVARKAYDLQPSSVIVSWLPQYHDCGLMFLLLTIVAGATCVLASPAEFIRNPIRWLELVSNFKATCTPVPSFALPLVVRRGGGGVGGSGGVGVGGGGGKFLNLQSLRNLVLINEPIYAAAVEEFIEKFAPFGLDPLSIAPSYGLAENCTFVSTSWRGDYQRIPTYNKLLPSARLGGGFDGEEEIEIEIIVVDPDNFELVEDGVEGEIWVGSASNACGYLGIPSLTREIFQGKIRGNDGRSFVRTGDRGVVRGVERYLYVMGRSSDVIRLGNREIHAHYLETAAFRRFPRLLRGGCLAAFEVGMERRRAIVLVAELQTMEGGGGGGGFRMICEGIREGVLEEVKVEVGLVVLVKSGSLPKTTSGKIQRWAAKESLMRGELEVVSKIWFGDQWNGLVRGERVDEVLKGGREGRGETEFLVSYLAPHSRVSLLSLL